MVDRHTYAYRGFYVDTWRGIDFLLSRPEVDPARVGVTGSSQGGGLTITTAAMRPEVHAAAAGAPYLCGFVDAIELTHTYPYEEINDYLRLYPERRADVEETLAYFDGISFADRIACPIIVNVGLQDNVCPPETGYALFERIDSKDKRLYPYDGHGHDAGRVRHAAVVEAFFARHLQDGRGADDRRDGAELLAARARRALALPRPARDRATPAQEHSLRDAVRSAPLESRAVPPLRLSEHSEGDWTLSRDLLHPEVSERARDHPAGHGQSTKKPPRHVLAPRPRSGHCRLTICCDVSRPLPRRHRQRRVVPVPRHRRRQYQGAGIPAHPTRGRPRPRGRGRQRCRAHHRGPREGGDPR